jgi:hypothetical protein
MATSATPGSVRHNRAESRFEIEVDGHLAVAEYELRGPELAMTHTFVPPELRGRGLAEQVVRAALEFARAEKLRVVPVCSYVARFIEKNPAYRSLLG